jgi:hypothetical protein
MKRDSNGAVTRAAARGVIAAMAMTGMRRVTIGFGLVQDAPPEELAKGSALVAAFLDRVPERNRAEVIELAHWAYGAIGGAVFGALWRSGVRTRWAGPVYGLAVWTLFETGVVPLLGLRDEREQTTTERLVVAADHVLYGAVVAGRPRSARA